VPPFILTLIAVLLLATFAPGFVLFLPRLFGMAL
jgi:TRAP-type C4-dicarboxylate transport system permease large subunit